MLSAACLLLVLAGCNHVQPHLKVPDLRITEPSLRATLVGYTGGAVVGGNRIDVLLNGEEIFPAKLEMIRAARKTITYAQYVFEEGAPAADTAQALAERCRAGVKVHVLIDAVGSLLMPSQYRDWMTEAGCEVAFYRPVTPWTIDRANYRNHRRILVADGRVGVTGGSGTSGKWSGDGKQEGQWRDTDMRVEGPVVNQLQGAFAENWLEATGRRPRRGRLLPAGPSRPRARSSRRSCAARPRAAAWRCTPCSCSRWPRRAGRSTSPIRTSCPTTR